jgi:hypothetical protein
MKRKLILTPFDHGRFYSMHKTLNEVLRSKQKGEIDIQHIIFSSVIMCGVDEIHSMGTPINTNTKLVTKNISRTPTLKYFDDVDRIGTIFKNYNVNEGVSASYFKFTIATLLYCMQTNSIPLLTGDLEKELEKAQFPSELSVPIQIFISSIENKKVELPTIRGDLNKIQVQKLIEVLESKQFSNYKESQAEIENTSILTNSTIKKIEKAGKDLIKNNSSVLFLKDSIINAIPVTAKLIDLFFGKLPGIVSNYATDIAVSYLKDFKSIPIYNCDQIWDNEIDKRARQFIKEWIGTALNMDLEPYLNGIIKELKNEGLI